MGADGRSLRVVLADDDQFSREGLRGTFEADGATVLGEASSLAEAVSIASAAKPDVVVIDPRLAGAESGPALAAITGAAPDARVAVLTDSAGESEVVSALTGGADSYLLKATPADQLVEAVRQTADGSTVLAGGAMQSLLAHLVRGHEPRAGRDQGARLSSRESEVLSMIVSGADNAEIGRALSISRHTVKQHVTNIFDKLGVRTRVEAAVMAVRHELD